VTQINKELVRQYFEDIYNRQNYAVCSEILAEDYMEWATAPFGQAPPGQVNGPEHTRESAEWLHAQFPDMHMTIETLIGEGDMVACRVYSEGTNLGKFNGILPPTGKRAVGRQSHWFRVADNKLVEHWATREDLPMLLQLGIIVPPGGRPA